MKKILLFTMLLLNSYNNYGQDSLKILFVGNSLIYYNDMPTILKGYFSNYPAKIKVFQKTGPGLNLNQHIKEIMGEDLTSQSFKLNIGTFEKEKFDFIVIQEATVRLLVPEFREIFYKNVETFVQIAQKNNSKLLFYQPYPIYRYPQKYCFPSIQTGEINCSDEYLNSTQELATYKEICKKLKKDYNIDSVPIGEYFETIVSNMPTVKLLTDNEHPNLLGSNIIAYLIFVKMIGKEPTLENIHIEKSQKDILLYLSNRIKNDKKI